ncbi:MAG TPA: MFS transporter [Rhizomicrobium sp.]|jgi:Na+/melibiose symporter-like transporter
MDALAPDNRLTNANFTKPRLAAFAAAALPAASLQLPLSVYLPNYYASHLGLNLAIVGATFSAVRLIDILFDPAIGVAIDATRTRFGRFRPWMLASVPILMVSIYMIFMAPIGATTGYLLAWLLVMYAGYSMVILGHSAWAAALAPKYHQRSRIYGVMQATGVLGTVSVLALPPILVASGNSSTAAGVQAMGLFIVAIIPIAIAFCVIMVREPVRVEVRERLGLRDYWSLIARPSMLRVLASDLFLALGPAITAVLYIFFFTQVLKYTRNTTTLLLLLYILAGIVGAPFWAQVAKRLGKHRTVMTACVLYGFAQAIVFFQPPGNLIFMIPGMFFAGFVVSAFTFLIRAMVADVSDEVRLDIGKDRTALLYALITSTSKVGSTLAAGIVFPIIYYFGFNPKEGVVNSHEALGALTACYVIVPVLTMFVGAAWLWGYKLDETRHDAIRGELRLRDEALQGAEGAVESLTGGTLPQAPALGLNAPT